QTEAVQAWWQAGGRGVVVLPTGTGKARVAVLAIAKAARPALVVTPPLALLNPWDSPLLCAFDVPLRRLGGGAERIESPAATAPARRGCRRTRRAPRPPVRRAGVRRVPPPARAALQGRRRGDPGAVRAGPARHPRADRRPGVPARRADRAGGLPPRDPRAG